MRTSLVCVAILASCTPGLPRSRAWISDQLEARTGGGIRTPTHREFAVPPGVQPDELSVDEAIAIAMWNNPTFQADLAQLGMARADLADAGVLPNPIVTLLIPVGSKELELTVRQSLSALWQRPLRVAAARADAAKVAEQLVQRGIDLARDVELAYTRAVLATTLLAFTRDTAVILNRLADIADARQRAGDAGAIETRSIRADAVAAQAAVGQAETDLALAHNELRMMLGAPDSFALVVARGKPLVAGGLARWITGALTERPDLRAAQHAIEAAGKRAGLERRQIFALTGMFDLNGNPFNAGPGIELPLPIFDRRQGGRIRAHAELERTTWTYVGLRRQVVREVSDAHARLVRANAVVAAWRDQIVPARTEARRLAQQAFEQGEEAFLVVLDATRALVDAGRRLAEAEAEEARASAELVRATGGRRAR